LFNDYEQIREGKMHVETGKALARTAGSIIRAISTEILYNKYQNKTVPIQDMEEQ
jgi:hypothetical protein